MDINLFSIALKWPFIFAYGFPSSDNDAFLAQTFKKKVSIFYSTESDVSSSCFRSAVVLNWGVS